MKIVAMRGENIFLVEVSTEKYALVNLKNKHVQYDKHAGKFLRFGYFEDPTYDEEIELKIKDLLT